MKLIYLFTYGTYSFIDQFIYLLIYYFINSFGYLFYVFFCSMMYWFICLMNVNLFV